MFRRNLNLNNSETYLKRIIIINYKMEENKMTENKKKIFNRYENSEIYKLIDPDSGFYYFGSTCGPLTQRRSTHRTYANKYMERKVYKAFNEIRWKNIKIMLEQYLHLDNKNEPLRAEIMAHVQDEKYLNTNKSWA